MNPTIDTEDGKAYIFTYLNNSKFQPVADINLRLDVILTTTSGYNWRLITENENTELYDYNTGKLLSITTPQGISHTLAYDATNGLLSSITHSNGRTLNFYYDASQRLTRITDPSLGNTTYSYNPTTGNLETITYPDLSTRTYKYNEPGYVPAGVTQTNLLTGIIDENNKRYATFSYDTNGKAISTEHASGGIDKYSVVRSADGSSVTVTDPLGTVRTTNLTTVQGVVKSLGESQPAGAGCTASTSNLAYDANGNIASRTDFNGITSCYAYNPRNLETARLEGLTPGKTCPANLSSYVPAATSDERKVLTDWHSVYRLSTQITEQGRTTSFSYYPNGNLYQNTVTDTTGSATPNPSRTWTYKYETLGGILNSGKLLSTDGPRTDISDITYYNYYSDSSSVPGASHQPGDLQSITNAVQHVTRFTDYDANGRLKSLTDPNGLVIGFTYDARGRLTHKTMDGNTTIYEYYPTGDLKNLIQPSGVKVHFDYDDAHRLTDITDAQGGNLHYKLDAIGNRIKEDITDANGTLLKTHSRKFDALSRLQQDIGAVNQHSDFEYDANGNLTKITDANGYITNQYYDNLNRLIQISQTTLKIQTATTPPDPLAEITRFKYDALDHLTQVTDAASTDGINYSTLYQYNGLDDLLSETSPKTGLTQYRYDSGGNLNQKTDANATTAIYQYDALNRLTGVDYPGTADDLIYRYDGNPVPTSAPGQLGRLTTAQRGSTPIGYRYDLRGNLQTVTGLAMAHPGPGVANAINYHYNADNQLDSIAFGSYRTVQYGFDSLTGRMQNISVSDQDNGSYSTNGYQLTRTLAGNISHLPFGPIKSLSYGNGLNLTRQYDQDYRLSTQTLGTATTPASLQNLGYQYDPAGNLKTITDALNANNNQSFNYDPFNRLSSATARTNLLYHYDSVGNRTDDYKGSAQTVYHYDLNSQRLLSQTGARPGTITTNAAGNTTHSRGQDYTYTADQRLSSVIAAAVTKGSYSYNAFGQRTGKTVGSLTTRFDYDPQGQLLNEASSNLTANYIYLEGEPLARADFNLNDPTGNVGAWNINYYHNNPLGAPLLITNPAKQITWNAQLEPFGSIALLSTGSSSQPLRFPGQYYDPESGLFNNGQRMYDSASGRFLESDRIGLWGGD